MRSAVFAGLALAFFAMPAQADTCSDLAATARAALSMEGLDADTRGQLQQLLNEANSGDASRCEQATGSVFQSSPEGEKAPARARRCEDSEKTV